MTKYMVSDNSPEAVQYRKELIDAKRDDVLTRLNKELEKSPFVGMMYVVKYEVRRVSFVRGWEVKFTCDDGRMFVVSQDQFLHIYHQPKQRQHRLNNRIKAYLERLALLMKKYMIEINEFYTSNFTI